MNRFKGLGEMMPAQLKETTAATKTATATDDPLFFRPRRRSSHETRRLTASASQ